MNFLDWIFIGLVTLLAIRCFSRGFVEELLSMAAIVAAVFAALLLYRPVGNLLSTQLGLKTLPEPAGFVIVFLLVFLFVKLVEHLVREGLEAAELEGADRVLGLALGVVEGLLLVCLLLVLLGLLAGTFKGLEAVLKGSIFANTLLPIIGPEVTKAWQGIDLKQLPGIKKGP